MKYLNQVYFKCNWQSIISKDELQLVRAYRGKRLWFLQLIIIRVAVESCLEMLQTELQELEKKM